MAQPLSSVSWNHLGMCGLTLVGHGVRGTATAFIVYKIASHLLPQNWQKKRFHSVCSFVCGLAPTTLMVLCLFPSAFAGKTNEMGATLVGRVTILLAAGIGAWKGMRCAQT